MAHILILDRIINSFIVTATFAYCTIIEQFRKEFLNHFHQRIVLDYHLRRKVGCLHHLPLGHNLQFLVDRLLVVEYFYLFLDNWIDQVFPKNKNNKLDINHQSAVIYWESHFANSQCNQITYLFHCFEIKITELNNVLRLISEHFSSVVC